MQKRRPRSTLHVRVRRAANAGGAWRIGLCAAVRTATAHCGMHLARAFKGSPPLRWFVMLSEKNAFHLNFTVHSVGAEGPHSISLSTERWAGGPHLLLGVGRRPTPCVHLH